MRNPIQAWLNKRAEKKAKAEEEQLQKELFLIQFPIFVKDLKKEMYETGTERSISEAMPSVIERTDEPLRSTLVAQMKFVESGDTVCSH